MTTTIDPAAIAARFRETAAGSRRAANMARTTGDTAAADELEQVAVDYDAAAEQLELQSTLPATSTNPRRMTVGRALEMLLESRGRAGSKSGAVTIGRSARGIVTWEVTAAADPDELEQLTAALDAAIAAHDKLADLYPMPEGE